MSELLFPSRCIFCGRIIGEDKLICADCLADDIVVKGKVCSLCGVGMEYCRCGRRKHHYARRIACVYYKNSVCRGVARFKFYRHTMLAEPYGTLMAENIKSKYSSVSFDGVMAVPMHWSKRIMRGYNGVDLLARRVSEQLSLPIIEGVLFRRFSLKNQKDMKSFSLRAANILDAFYVKEREKIKGKTILLLDDVCTSGATLDECAKMLRLYGAKKVYACTLATVAVGTR